MAVHLFYDDIFLRHATGGHPERAQRLSTCTTHLREVGLWQRCQHPPFEPASVEDLQRVHRPELVRRAQLLAEGGGGNLDPDTIVSPESFQVACWGAGAAIGATRLAVEGSAKRAFALVRPPGHHATYDQSMGFCLFNNVAVAAALATRVLGLDRVLIVDWDVHHGNGTQDIFWRDSQVGFFSMHRYPFYPGSGDRDAQGEGPGRGYTWNLPVAYGTPRKAIVDSLAQQLEKFAQHVRPQLVLISAGFDAHREDPIGDLGLETEDFATMTRLVAEVADIWCDGRIVSLLEGGYHPQRLAESVEAHLRELEPQS